ncbi:MAG: heme ABC exporter ATP-binding protein CcmA [Myxococcales bacterium]
MSRCSKIWAPVVGEHVASAIRVVASGVTRRFGASWVLRGVDAIFEPGTVTVVEGANGAGKSTLLGIIAGLIRPTAGEVTWDPSGKRVGEQRWFVGWVGHDSLSYRELTARENVVLAGRLCGLRAEVVEQSLDRVGARAFADKRVGLLSRGQRQRVALARGIVHSPRLLLLDEPFTGLDSAGCMLLEKVIGEERNRGAIIVLVSHDASLATRLGAARATLERGKLKITGPRPSV